MRVARRVLVVLAAIGVLVPLGTSPALASGSTEIPGSRLTFYTSTNTFAVNDTACDGRYAAGVWKYGVPTSSDPWNFIPGPTPYCEDQSIVKISAYEGFRISYRAALDVNNDGRIECGVDVCGPWHKDFT